MRAVLRSVVGLNSTPHNFLLLGGPWPPIFCLHDWPEQPSEARDTRAWRCGLVGENDQEIMFALIATMPSRMPWEKSLSAVALQHLFILFLLPILGKYGVHFFLFYVARRYEIFTEDDFFRLVVRKQEGIE